MKLAGGIAAGLVLGIFSVAVLAQPIYVANPGESFGPIKMGEFAPIAPRIICITADPSNSHNKLVLTYYLESEIFLAARGMYLGLDYANHSFRCDRVDFQAFRVL